MKDHIRHKRLIWQIFPANLATILVAIVAITWYASTTLYSFFLNESERDLAARAYLIKSRVEKLLLASDIPELRSFCTRVGHDSATRITIIDADGKVLADSDESSEKMENHRLRPEIAAAFSGRQGRSQRFSRTLQESMLYLALPLAGNLEATAAAGKAQVAHVLRLAVPVTAIEKTLKAVQLKIAFGSLLVIAIAALVTLVISRNISRPLEVIKRGAEAFAAGNFTEKMLPRQPRSVSLEVMTLAASMDRMAEQLDEKIKDIETQRNRLDTVFSSMVEAVIAIDPEERIISLNAAAARLLAITGGEGKYVQSVIRNPDLQRQIGRVLASGAPMEEEIVLRDEEGDRLLQTRVVTLFDGNSRNAGVLVVINDMTKLRRLETIRRDFVANVSHELRTPITSIRGYVETLLDGALDDRATAVEFLKIVQRQSDRLNAIIDDLLALSRIEKESREGGIDLQEAPLLPVLAAAVQTCQVEADKAEVAVVLDCPENLLASMNPTLLEQAVVNLLVNAIKYSRRRMTVTLQAFAGKGPGGSTVTISVRDTGCGIAAEHLPRLFERFYRSDRARSRAIGGTGLGLAIVKHIVQAHAGSIDVQSREGVGSEFRITLSGRTV